MDVETKNPRRTRTIIALSVVAAIAVSVVSNIAWAQAHADEPAIERVMEAPFTSLDHVLGD